MQITLLPPLLPTEGVTSVPTASLGFTPGARIEAMVLAAALPGGNTLLSLSGREMPAGGTLPYPPGTTLRLEVVQGGEQPVLRLLAVEASPVDETTPPAPQPPGPPVSAVNYGLAAAVLAAREAHDVRAAALVVARWIPVLQSRGILTAAQGDLLLKALAPVPIHAGPVGTPEGARAAEALAQAIADRVADGGVLLERRLADVVRNRPDAHAAAAGDLRSRLAVLAHLVQDASPGLEGARDAVASLQSALLAEQARTAAHLARDGVVDVRVPVQGEADEAEVRVRMRIERDAPDHAGDEDAAPWRQVRIDLALAGLGRVQVRLGVLSSQVRVEFLVEHPGAADRVEAGLAELSTALEGAGFAHVLSRVLVDPVTVCAPDTLPDLPVQRTILDTRA